MWQRCALGGVALLLCGAAQANYSFDNPEQYLADAAQWPSWSDVLRLNASDSALLADCVANIDSCPKRYHGVTRLIVRARELAFKDQLRLVNRYVNKRRYRRDRPYRSAEGENLRNQWRPLLETLIRGGDCEDFATAKYFLLRELGVPADAMRVVVLWDTKTRDFHAMLAADMGDVAWFLETDNTIQRGPRLRKYRFQYSLNEKGIWDHSLTLQGSES
jgi:predicted transglutaminase-like cysteine proteinase